MRRQPSSLVPLAAGALLAGALASGCGLGDRQRYADTLGQAPRQAARAGAVHVTTGMPFPTRTSGSAYCRT